MLELRLYGDPSPFESFCEEVEGHSMAPGKRKEAPGEVSFFHGGEFLVRLWVKTQVPLQG